MRPAPAYPAAKKSSSEMSNSAGANIICQINSLTYVKDSGGIYGVGFTASDLTEQTLAPNAATDIFCPVSGDAVRLPDLVGGVDLSIFVSFGVPYVPMSFSRCFNFVTRPDDKGSLRWVQKGFRKSCERPQSVLKFTGPRTR